MKPTDVFRVLANSRAPIESIKVPTKSGVYAVYLDRPKDFPLVGLTSDDPIYVGSSSNLNAREFEMHFSSGGSGFSTLRRSIGAILKDKLALRAQPRSSGNSPTNISNYRFDDSGEARLTEWMNSHLSIGVCPLDGDYESVEKNVIQIAMPALNLTGSENPHKKWIKELRTRCREEAKKSH